MRLININAFLRREQQMSTRRQVDCRTKVFEFRDDETIKYAILSHRWIDPTEVDFEELVDLARMDKAERNEVRGRLGYKKIFNTCQQAQKDGYEWVWVDTCCIDKRSSAELSEAINSMYRWYGNAKICYAYLHDVDGSSFPTKKDDGKHPKSNGWPEWFSRGWTLQEMIAPRNLRFFNKDWQPIGDKEMLARTLKRITRVPEHVLTDGLEGNRPCVAQIMSWAANRTTTRVEDKAYSLMGLLDVNMSMLYGEGKKAFHRLQLEIIRSSNDQSIFAWGFRSSSVRIGSILADDPSFFEYPFGMELMDHSEFIQKFPELSSTNADHFDVFPITNRGIQIWMLFRRYRGSNSVFKAYLPCWDGRGGSASIDLVLWNSNYYRYPSTWHATLEDSPAEFRQVYLRYQDTPNHTVTFDIDDTGLIGNGFARSCVDPESLTGNTVTLTNANPFSVKTYSEEQGNGRIEVVFGQCLGLDWVDLPDESCLSAIHGVYWKEPIYHEPDWAFSMADEPSEYDSSGRLWIRHVRLAESTWIVRIYRVAWERSKIRLRIEVFQDSPFRNGLHKWNAYDVEKFGGPSQDPRGLMLHDTPSKHEMFLRTDRAIIEFSLASEGTKLGDYGYFTDSGQFCSQGNLFSDFTCLLSEADITPRQKTVTGYYDVDTDSSLPNNPVFNSFLASLAPRLTNSYLVTRIAQCRRGRGRDPNAIVDLCTIRKPLVWHPDLVPFALLRGDRDESDDDPERSSCDDSEVG